MLRDFASCVNGYYYYYYAGRFTVPVVVANYHVTESCCAILSVVGQELDAHDVTNALNLAALKGCGEIVSLLLEKGADVTQADGSGNAPVHSAVIEYVHCLCHVMFVV
jgi:hypothetical protein